MAEFLVHIEIVWPPERSEQEREEIFAAELLQVREGEEEWTAAAEQALRGLARSILVPDRIYREVAAVIDRRQRHIIKGANARAAAAPARRHRRADARRCR